VRAFGSIAIQLRDVASGALDGYVGGRVKPSPVHDVGPGALLVTEAGGLATDAQGRPPLEDRRTLVAGGDDAHRVLRAILTDEAVPGEAPEA
jgi:fructose-1,6-bisphosphatase/inositol monophosphatase family enzyme